MLVVIFGESCTGKSTLARRLSESLEARVFTGRDYLRLEKNENRARDAFSKLLEGAVHGTHVIWVVAEPDLLALVPTGAVRILVTAELECIKCRFAERMGGKLPPPVAAMLEKKHGAFDGLLRDYHLKDGAMTDTLLTEVIKRCSGESSR